MNYKIISSFYNDADMNKLTRVAYIIDDGDCMGVLTSEGDDIKIIWYADHKISYLETIAENYVNIIGE